MVRGENAREGSSRGLSLTKVAKIRGGGAAPSRGFYAYNSSIIVRYFSTHTLRFSFKDGVSSPVSTVKSEGRIPKRLIDSKFASCWLTVYSSASTSSTTLLWFASSGTELPSMPWAFAQVRTSVSFNVTRAIRYFCLSP